MARILTTVFLKSLLLVSLLFPLALAAEQVTPSERVKDDINIRSAPSADSPSMGVLQKGESLELLGSVPWWHKIKLPNGQPAFVSKAWTTVIPEIQAPSPDSKYTMHVIDVGTGLGIYLQGPDFNLIYDAGSMDDRSTGDKNRFIAYLKEVNPDLKTIDHLIVSHPHRDHIVLLPDVLSEYEVKHVWDSGAGYNSCDYRSFIDSVRLEDDVQYHASNQNFGAHTKVFEPTDSACSGLGDNFTLTHGSQITDDPIILGAGASMSFLYINAEKHSDVNENSLVLRLDIAGKRLLLMGDAEAGARRDPSTAPDPNSVEDMLLTCCVSQIKADVMVVGHHGSETSSRSVFLDAVEADHYIISSGPFKYQSVQLPDESVRQALISSGQLHETNLTDDACKGNPAKIGRVEPNADKQKPGGCNSIQVTVSVGNEITVKSFPL
jgi:beta-lactamase superfamily II metal-dependent hydrolase